jgi:hypothetical protein
MKWRESFNNRSHLYKACYLHLVSKERAPVTTAHWLDLSATHLCQPSDLPYQALPLPSLM